MEEKQAIALFSALGHAQRLAAFRLLMRCGPAGLAAGELAQRLVINPSALSFHLKEMEGAGLVSATRKGRNIVYRADFSIGARLSDFLQRDCCAGVEAFAGFGPHDNEMETIMLKPPYRVLVLCTGNSARSILAEGVLGGLGGKEFIALSAGSKPKGEPNPLALATLRAHGHAVDGFRSKSWDEFAVPGAPAIDIVITVCDQAKGEACPVWPGHPVSGHWGLEDPSDVTGSDEAKRAAFEATYAELTRRFEQLVALPLQTMEPAAIRQALAAIHDHASGQQAGHHAVAG